MGILGIENRTENWKTARYFAPFFDCEDARVRLLQRLLKPFGAAPEVDPKNIKTELFWKGMRDYEHKTEEKVPVPDRVLLDHYKRRFENLHQKVKQVAEFQDLKCHNYRPEENLKNFCANLRNTEIDIVLATSQHLFIGEAKYKSNFGANSTYVLAHQLIRQYVTARILLDLTKSRKRIVLFLVVDKSDADKRNN